MKYIQLTITIRTPFRTRSMSQKFHHIFHSRIIAEHPSRCYRTIIGSINQCQRIGHFTRILPDQHIYVGMLADFSFIQTAYQSRQSPAHPFSLHHTKEAVEFFLTFQQRSKIFRISSGNEFQRAISSSSKSRAFSQSFTGYSSGRILTYHPSPTDGKDVLGIIKVRHTTYRPASSDTLYRETDTEHRDE